MMIIYQRPQVDSTYYSPHLLLCRRSAQPSGTDQLHGRFCPLCISPYHCAWHSSTPAFIVIEVDKVLSFYITCLFLPFKPHGCLIPSHLTLSPSSTSPHSRTAIYALIYLTRLSDILNTTLPVLLCIVSGLLYITCHVIYIDYVRSKEVAKLGALQFPRVRSRWPSNVVLLLNMMRSWEDDDDDDDDDGFCIFR
jgi:hypothetical protein